MKPRGDRPQSWKKGKRKRTKPPSSARKKNGYSWSRYKHALQALSHKEKKMSAREKSKKGEAVRGGTYSAYPRVTKEKETGPGGKGER